MKLILRVDLHMHVSYYDSDFEITDESEDSEYYFDTEELEDSSSDETTDEDMEPPLPASHRSQTSSLRTRVRGRVRSRWRSRGIMRPRIAHWTFWFSGRCTHERLSRKRPYLIYR